MILADAVRKVRKMTSRKLNVSSSQIRGAVAAMLASCLICVFFLPDTLHALDPNVHVTQYMHTAFRTQDGSLAAGMYHIAQTSDGFLWFLSLPGDLYRFDGVRIGPWQLPAATSINKVKNIFADHKGGLWVLGSHEIVRLKEGVVTSHFDLEGTMFEGISEDPDGSLWVAHEDKDSPLCHITERAVKCFGKSDGIPIPNIDVVLGDGRGGFWLGGATALVHWHLGESEKYQLEGVKAIGIGIQSVARGSDGTVWVGILGEGPGGLRQLKNGAMKAFVTPNFDGTKIAVTSMLFDHDGNLWVGTDAKGLFRIHGDAVEHYGRTEGLSGDAVWALFEDREGIVWAGTTSGIDSFRNPAIATFSEVEGLGSLPAGVLASRDGSIWVANGGSLDRIRNGTVSSIRRKNGLPGEQVTRMLEDHAGNLWMGVDDGLYLFEDGRFRPIPGSNHQQLGMVIGLIEDIDGNIWAECRGETPKLVRIRDFRAIEEISPPRLPTAWKLAPDPHGGIWIATKKGDLVLFREGAPQKFPLNSTAKNPSPHEIIAQENGSVIGAFDDGLMEFRQGKVQRMTTKNGLPCNEVISLIEDNAMRWWLYTRCGVVEIPDSELERWWKNPETVVESRTYDRFDGAQPNVAAFNSAARSIDGRVWFASGVVVQALNPSTLPQKAIPAETYIESVTVDRRQFPATASLTIAPHPRDLQVDYTSPTFTIPQRVRFRYRLDGYDHDWHEAGSRRQAFYTDLRPGKYSFRVIACNSDGEWDASPAKLDFSITPAYYQTNWFRVLCVAFFLALLWAAYRWRVRQLHHQFEITLDARVGERTRIARELHDTLLQSFHGVLLRFQTAFQLLPERPVEAKEKLGSAIDQAAEAITEGRDAVQGLRDSTTEVNDLALAISTLGEDLAADASNLRPSFRVAVEGESRNLHPILRDETYKIAAEALRNAFSHAQAREVEVELRYDNDQFRLRVRDDGKGIDPAILAAKGSQGHYGLPGIRERAKIMGAKLTVWSEVDAGTEVELRVPAGIAYTTGRKPSWFSRIFSAKA